jgi:hypothetical protein
MARAALEQGASTGPQVAKAMGCSLETAKARIRELGVRHRPGRPLKFSDDVCIRHARSYQSSIEQWAKLNNCSVPAARRTLRRGASLIFRDCPNPPRDLRELSICNRVLDLIHRGEPIDIGELVLPGVCPPERVRSLVSLCEDLPKVFVSPVTGTLTLSS